MPRKPDSATSKVGAVAKGIFGATFALGIVWAMLWGSDHPLLDSLLGAADSTSSSDASHEVYGAEEPAASWRCRYEPTINDDWHDDVLCSNGTETERPTLLEGQFVTQAEMEAAGAEYEVFLNGTP